MLVTRARLHERAKFINTMFIFEETCKFVPHVGKATLQNKTDLHTLWVLQKHVCDESMVCMRKKMIASRCGICSSPRATIVRKRLRYNIKRNVLRCVKCGFVYLERPSISKRFYTGKKYRAHHGPTLGKKSSPRDLFNTYLPYQHQIHESMGGLLKPSVSILDVGCSAGHFLHSLKGKVKKRVGLELSRDEVSFIRKNLDFRVYDKPIEHADIAEGPFDIVTALQVLEHVEDPVGFLKNIRKHLKKNGTLYLELPNIDDVLLTQYRIRGYEDFYYREPHLSYFSKETLRRALAKAGFSGTIRTVQRYTLLNHIHWITAQAPLSSFELGMNAQIIKHAKGKEARQLNTFIKDADRKYRDLVGKLGLGESLVFVGKKRL